jgi:hypothetical protein
MSSDRALIQDRIARNIFAMCQAANDLADDLDAICRDDLNVMAVHADLVRQMCIKGWARKTDVAA